MPVFTRDPLLLGGESIQTESTLGEAFRAGAVTMQEGLLGSLARIEEIDEAESGRFASGSQLAGVSQRQISVPTSPLLTPEQARQKLRDNGLEQNLSVPEGGIRQATLNILMDRKRDELRRQTIMAQSRGIGGVFANLTGALAGSFVDPTNIALAFVPVVSEVKYARLLASAGGTLGRTGVRAAVGAAEGFVGLAPVEVLNYYAYQQQQADYDAYDSMLAVAGGAFFGSALHAGAGLIGDGLRGFRSQRTPELRVDDMTAPTGAGEVPQRSALTPEQYERAIVMDRLAEGRPVTRAQAEAPRVRTGAEAGAVIDGRLDALSRVSTEGLLDPAKVRALVAEAGELEDLVRAQARAEREGVVISPENRLSPEELAIADTRRQQIKVELERHNQAQAAGKQLDELQKKLDRIDSDGDLIRLADELLPPREPPPEWSPKVQREIDADPYMPIRPFVASLTPETQANALRMAIAQAASGRPIEVSPALYTDPSYFSPDSAFAAAQRNAVEMDGANPQAAEWADTLKPMPDDVESLRAQVDEDAAKVDEMLAGAGREVPESFRASIAEAELDAQKQGKAAKVAAYCLMRTGG